MKEVEGALAVDDVLGSRPVGIEDVQPVDMREFGGDAAEIVPDAGEDRFDLAGGFFRKGGGKLLAADAVLLEPRTERAHDARGEMRPCACGWSDASDVQHPDRKPCPSIRVAWPA